MYKKQQFIFFITMAFLSSHTLSPMGDVDTKFNKLISDEAAFQQALLPRKFPTNHNHFAGYFDLMSKNIPEQQQQQELKAQLISFAENTVPVCSDAALIKAAEFLTAKKQSNNPIEQNVYLPLTFDHYIFRLYHNRPLVCYQAQDDTLLMGKKQIDSKAYPKHALIGTSQEEYPFVLEDLISYPEREIAELFGISSPTFFINKGDRANIGNYSDKDDYEKKGIFVGLVGPRYENPEQLACKTLIDATKKQDGDIEITASNLKTKNASLIGKYFRPSLHTERIKKSIEPFLIDIANAEKNTYVHVVNLGGGWWSLFEEWSDENAEGIKASFRAYKELLETHKFPNIDTIDFSWFTNNNKSYAKKLFKQINDNKLTIDNNSNIKIKFSLRNTADKLTGEDAGKRLVAMYPWDSASGPGNEFLLKALSGSGDPVAACCSLIFALQHTRINGENIFNNIVKRVNQFISKYPKYADLMKSSQNPNYTNPQVPASPIKTQEKQPSQPTQTWYQKIKNLSLRTKMSIGAAAALVGGLSYYYWYTRNQ